MTVLTREQAEVILASIPKPTVCDLCETGEPKNPMGYGPFTAWLCSDCQPKWVVHKLKNGRTI